MIDSSLRVDHFKTRAGYYRYQRARLKGEPSADPGLVLKHKKASTPDPADLDMQNRIEEYERSCFLDNRAAWRSITQPLNRRIVTLRMYQRDVIARRTQTFPVQIGGGDRGKITSFSRAACRRMVLTARNLVGLVTMLTLTYPGEYETDGAVVKSHFKRLKQWLIRRGVGGFWFLEFQERGAPHFHIFLNGRVPYLAVAAFWYQVVASGDLRHLKAGTSIEKLRHPHAAGVYAAKYGKKAVQKEVPADYLNVGRFWGCFGGVKAEMVTASYGEYEDMADRLRILKRLVNAKRRAAGFGPVRDKGRVGITLYDVSAWAFNETFLLCHREPDRGDWFSSLRC